MEMRLKGSNSSQIDTNNSESLNNREFPIYAYENVPFMLLLNLFITHIE